MTDKTHYVTLAELAKQWRVSRPTARTQAMYVGTTAGTVSRLREVASRKHKKSKKELAVASDGTAEQSA